jgi:hypothetical protein
VVDVEGRTLRLTGTAEEQYKEWRELLHQLYLEETGVVPTAGVTAAGTTPATTATPASPPPAVDPKAPVKIANEKPDPGTPVRP